MNQNKWAFVGAPCNVIEEFSNKIIQKGRGIFSGIFVDESHAPTGLNRKIIKENDTVSWSFFSNSINTDIDLISNKFDIAFYNGNHFEAPKQLVFIHPEKEDSLKRRIKQLTNIKAYVLCANLKKPFNFLPEGPPIYEINQTKEVLSLILRSHNIAPILGLVLAGGKSSRMGERKENIHYRGISQKDFLILELNSLSIKTLVSCGNNEAKSSIDLPDQFLNIGPLGGILTAFQKYPNYAVLAVACDLPLVDRKILENLISNRNPEKSATAFFNSKTGFPDPLLTIYEPKSYPRLLEFLSFGYSCPRKMLINSDIEIIKIEDDSFLLNANTPDEKEEAKNRMY